MCAFYVQRSDLASALSTAIQTLGITELFAEIVARLITVMLDADDIGIVATAFCTGATIHFFDLIYPDFIGPPFVRPLGYKTERPEFDFPHKLAVHYSFVADVRNLE